MSQRGALNWSWLTTPVFRFFIQTRTSSVEEEPLRSEETETRDKEEEEELVSVVPKTALIVEDNMINQTVLQRQLTKAGWKCDGKSHP